MKLVRTDENIYTAGDNRYVKVRFEGIDSLATVIEITENSYKRYINSNEYKEDVIHLTDKKGKKILLFHNNPYRIPTRSKKYESDIYRADILVCCYSLFLDNKLRKKAALKTPLPARTKVFESGGRKFLKIESMLEGLFPENKFKHDEKEIALCTLLKRIG